MSLDVPGLFLLSGKTIVVTGASSGIGRQCAIRASECGASVVAMGRNPERLKETVDALASGHEHDAIEVDLTDFEAVERSVQTIRKNKAEIHGIVHSAGISTTLPFRMTTPERMGAFLQTNVIAAMHLTRVFLGTGAFGDAGGSVVFLSSVMGTVGGSGKTLYSMSKGALIAGARSLAIELAKRHIRVNCIVPGVVDTPMSRNAVYSQDAESLARITSLHPLGLGSPDDVAYASIYLLSDASRWVTGSNLVVDGGYTAR